MHIQELDRMADLQRELVLFQFLASESIHENLWEIYDPSTSGLAGEDLEIDSRRPGLV
jgi:hypothetical protein